MNHACDIMQMCWISKHPFKLTNENNNNKMKKERKKPMTKIK